MDLPIARTSLHGEVTARLRDMIVEARLQPGERIQEIEVAKLLGVSRTPVREALKVLASEGLADQRQHILRVLRRKHLDHRAAQRQEIDQAFRGQHLERLAHGGA